MGYPAWYLDDPAAIVTLPRSPRWESEDFGVENARIMHETQRGVRHAYHLFRRRVKSYTFRIPFSMLDEFQAIHDATYGDVLPFYYVPDVTLFVASPLAGAILCRKEKDFLPRKVGAGVWTSTLEGIYDYTLTITEELESVTIED